MLKRLLLLAAMGLALAACGPSTSSTAPGDGVDTPASSDSVLPAASDMIESASPSP